MKAKNTIRGFTLIELMIVVALIALFLTAATPSIRVYLENTKVRNVAESIAAGMQKARAHAITNGRPTEIFINAVNGVWTISDFNATRIPQWAQVETFTWGAGGHNWTGIQINNVIPNNATRVTFNRIGRVMPQNLLAPLAPVQSLDVNRTTAMNGVLTLRVQADMARGIRVCAPHLDGTGDSKACNP